MLYIILFYILYYYSYMSLQFMSYKSRKFEPTFAFEVVVLEGREGHVSEPVRVEADRFASQHVSTSQPQGQPTHVTVAIELIGHEISGEELN